MLNGPLFRTMFSTYNTLSSEERNEIVQRYIDGPDDALTDPWDKFYLKNCQRHGGEGTRSHMQQTSGEMEAQPGKQQEEEDERQEEMEEKPLSTEVKVKKRRGNYLSETLDVDAWLALSSKLRAERMRILQGRDKKCRLTFMAVHQEFHRRGIGSMMLRTVCDATDKVQGRCACVLSVPYVLSVPEGVQLYTNFGFGTIREVETPHGNITSMLRAVSR